MTTARGRLQHPHTKACQAVDFVNICSKQFVDQMLATLTSTRGVLINQNPSWDKNKFQSSHPIKMARANINNRTEGVKRRKLSILDTENFPFAFFFEIN